MSEPWTTPGAFSVIDQPGGDVTLVDESTFAISSPVGDMVPSSAQGLFVRDTRILSRFELRVNAGRPETLTAVTGDPFSATFVSQVQPRPGRADATLMVFRSRYVGQGMREDIVIRNYGDEPTFCLVELFLDADFADLFAVKEGRARDPDGAISRAVHDESVELSYRRGTVNRGTVLRFSPAPSNLGEDLVSFDAIVPARGEWNACVEVHPVIEGRAIDPRYRCGQPVEQRRLQSVSRGGAVRCLRWRPTTRVFARARPKGRGPRGASDIRSRFSRTGGPGGGSSLVHDGLRPRLVAHVLDGPDRGSRPRVGRAPDAGEVPRRGHRPPDRRAARKDPARDALRGSTLAFAGRRKHLLRDG